MKRFVCGLLAATWVSVSSAQTLAEVFDDALANDPTYLAASGTYNASREVFAQALAQMLPTVSASWTSTGTHSGFPSLGGYNTQSRQLTLAQPIFHIDHWIQLSKGSAQTKQVYATYAASLQDLILRVAQKYFDVLAAEDSLRFSRSQRKTFARHLEQTQQRFEVGLIAITDVHDAKARHDNAVAKEIAAENTLADEKERLREITGTFYDALTPLPTEGPIPLTPPEPADAQAWVEQALAHNWELKSAYYAKTAAEKEVWRLRSTHLPTLDLDGSLKRGNSTPPLSYTVDTKSIGVTLKLPILQGGQVLSKTREAKGLRMKATADYDQTLKSITSQANRAYRGVITQISSVESLQQAVRSNESALEATEAAYDVGTRTIVDVLDAQTNLLSAQRDNAKAQYDYLLEALKLRNAAGTLSPGDLYLTSAWLEGKTMDVLD